MTEAAFDEILRRLVAAGAEFVVIGGLAWGQKGSYAPPRTSTSLSRPTPRT